VTPDDAARVPQAGDARMPAGAHRQRLA